MAEAGDDERGVISTYRAWLPAEIDRRSFIQQGIIVPDANVLLALYELTTSSQEAIFNALEQVADRLWLPHQVGLEVVRARRSVVERRRKAFRQAKTDINNGVQAAQAELKRAAEAVERLLIKHAGDVEAARELRLALPAIAEFPDIIEWRETLEEALKLAQDEYDMDEDSLEAGDRILDRIVLLYGDRVGHPFFAEELHRLERLAIDFRFPNKVPPGFKDAGKASGLLSIGDYLVWEQLLRHAEALPSGQLITFVTKDEKEDWWELDRAGSPRRVLCELEDEMWHRSCASLRLETLNQFLEGVATYLDVAVDDSAFAELARVTRSES